MQRHLSESEQYEASIAALGLTLNATLPDIEAKFQALKKQYKQDALRLHPDRGGDEELFKAMDSKYKGEVIPAHEFLTEFFTSGKTYSPRSHVESFNADEFARQFAEQQQRMAEQRRQAALSKESDYLASHYSYQWEARSQGRDRVIHPLFDTAAEAEAIAARIRRQEGCDDQVCFALGSPSTPGKFGVLVNLELLHAYHEAQRLQGLQMVADFFNRVQGQAENRWKVVDDQIIYVDHSRAYFTFAEIHGPVSNDVAARWRALEKDGAFFKGLAAAGVPADIISVLSRVQIRDNKHDSEFICPPDIATRLYDHLRVAMAQHLAPAPAGAADAAGEPSAAHQQTGHRVGLFDPAAGPDGTTLAMMALIKKEFSGMQWELRSDRQLVSQDPITNRDMAIEMAREIQHELAGFTSAAKQFDQGAGAKVSYWAQSRQSTPDNPIYRVVINLQELAAARELHHVDTEPPRPR